MIVWSAGNMPLGAKMIFTGALSYDLFVFLVVPFLAVEMEPMEYDPSSTPNIPTAPVYNHPSLK